MKKQTAIQVVKVCPPEFALDELIDRLRFVDKLENGLDQIKQGKVVDHRIVVEKIEQWKRTQ